MRSKSLIQTSLVLTLFIVSLMVHCGTHKGVVVKNRKVTPHWAQWQELSTLRGEIQLPSLYRIDSDSIQMMCLEKPDSLQILDPTVYVDKKIVGNLKPVVHKLKDQFAELLAQSLPDSSRYPSGFIKDIISSWHCVLYGLHYRWVNPDSIRFAFQEGDCSLPDTIWFQKGRKIACGAVVIDSITMISEDKIGQQEQELLDQWFKQKGVESSSQLLFRMHKSEKGYFKITAYSVVYALKTISTYVHEQKFSFDTVFLKKRYAFDEFNFSLTVNRNDSRIYYVEISPSPNRENSYCGAFGKRRSFFAGKKSICTFHPHRTEYGFRVDLTLSTVYLSDDQASLMVDK